MPDEYFAKPLSNESIAEIAYAWREAFGIEPYLHSVDVVKIVENVLPVVYPPFSLVIETASILDGIEAYTEFEPPTIVVRENVYMSAIKRDGRARWTFAHELGHLMLHDSAVPLARAPEQYKKMQDLPAYASTEKQADKFAAAFLMPQWIVESFSCPIALSTACGVSYQAAKIQLEQRARRDRRYLPAAVKRYIGEL